MSNSVAEEGDGERGLMLTMIGKAEMPKTTLLISVCQVRASPLKVDGTHKGAIAFIVVVNKIQYQDLIIGYKMRRFCTLSQR
ncbi:MAG: hypothetical protein PVH82_12390 [Desulfobacteraceae bacterium]